MYREVSKKRAEAIGAGTALDYSSYETKLLDLIVELKGALLDIEMALEQSLDSARSSFFQNVRVINDQIADAQSTLMEELTGEFIDFAAKLKEELNREREQFVIKYE